MGSSVGHTTQLDFVAFKICPFHSCVATLGQCETRTNINREIIGSCLKFEPFLAIVIIVIKTK